VVHGDGPVGLDGPRVEFDDEPAVLDAGAWLVATLATFLRAFTFGRVRRLDALLGEALVRAWRTGAGRPTGGW
jgi:hypothetical protein